jgi:predicted dehydrogenase
VAALGLGWWSDVLADAIQRTPQLQIVSCFSRSAAKRQAFAHKYGCTAAPSYEAILHDPTLDGVINTTPNAAHLETTRAAAAAGKHVFLDKPIAHTIADGQAIIRACQEADVVLAIGYQRRREAHVRWLRQQIAAGAFGQLVQAEGNISRDRLGQFDLSSWRYQAAGMPGGVMLQIGIHYTDILAYLLGPIVAVSARTAQLVLPGDNPDVASLLLEHANGALSTLSASYASAAEYYLLNVYGKDATAYYTWHDGLRYLRRGSTTPMAMPCRPCDTLVEELEEFAASVRGEATPEVDGASALESLAVIRAGIRSAQEGRRVTVAEIWDTEGASVCTPGHATATWPVTS